MVYVGLALRIFLAKELSKSIDKSYCVREDDFESTLNQSEHFHPIVIVFR